MTLSLVQAPNFEAEERRAWQLIAEGHEAALAALSPGHPLRSEFQQALRDARVCAGLPTVRGCVA